MCHSEMQTQSLHQPLFSKEADAAAGHRKMPFRARVCCPLTWGQGRWQTQASLSPVCSWLLIQRFTPRHPVPGVWMVVGSLGASSCDPCDTQISPKPAATEGPRPGPYAQLWGSDRGTRGVLGAPRGHPLPHPPCKSEREARTRPLHPLGFLHFEMQTCLSMQMLREVGPNKSLWAGRCLAPGQAPQGAQVSGGEGGAAASPPNPTRPQSRLGSAA